MARKTRSREKPREPAAPESPPIKLLPPAVGLQLLVFTAGAVLMGLEIAGSRVLAPHFGNSVFVWGSLISVFLIALAAGYYVGGRVADRHPSRVLLNSICAAVSLVMFLIALVAYPFCQALLEGGLGEQTGPLVASMVLFLPPSVGMGMVSPMAIRLAAESIRSVGKIAGTLYALSTGGSIVGTLVTTFVLIPHFGLGTILKGLAAALLVVSLITFPLRRTPQTASTIAALIVLAAVLAASPAASETALHPGDRLVAEADTPYHHIAVIDDAEYPIREMRFDRYTESYILTTPPHSSPNGYTDYFHLAFLAQPQIERALFIGAGGGVGPRAFQMHNPNMAIDVVDIDPKVLELAEKHFFLKPGPNMRLIADDGRMFVLKSQDQYDAIFLDAFTIGGRIPFHLVTAEFLALCRDRLSDGGVFVMNLNSAVTGPKAKIFQSMQRTAASVFPQVHVFAKDNRKLPEQSSMNVILVATNSPEPIEAGQWQARAARHESRSYVKAEHLAEMAKDLRTDLPEVPGAPIFTDDYAPIETMAF